MGRREGLAMDALELLKHLIDPRSPRNPWKDERIRIRNQLMVVWLYGLGLRRGELLAIKVGDVKFQENTVLVPRRHDDKEDPRLHQPTAKTRDRLLSLSPSLSKLTLAYITVSRREIMSGRKGHPFLFVTDDGKPLSLSGLKHVFQDLRDAEPKKLCSLTPHVLRHTWNELFSNHIDRQGGRHVLGRRGEDVQRTDGLVADLRHGSDVPAPGHS